MIHEEKFSELIGEDTGSVHKGDEPLHMKSVSSRESDMLVQLKHYIRTFSVIASKMPGRAPSEELAPPLRYPAPEGPVVHRERHSTDNARDDGAAFHS